MDPSTTELQQQAYSVVFIKRHPATMPNNIYVVGAQSTGKTTLVTALSEHFTNSSPTTITVPAPLILPEVARTVLKQLNFTGIDIKSSVSNAMLMQKTMLEVQHSTERAAGTQWFISDRSGLDAIVYTKRYAGEEGARELMRTSIWEELKKRMEHSLVVVCGPGADWLEDDGVRLMPESQKDWVAFHHLFCSSLKDVGLEYVVVPCEMKDLTERVKFVLSCWESTS